MENQTNEYNLHEQHSAANDLTKMIFFERKSMSSMGTETCVRWLCACASHTCTQFMGNYEKWEL